MVAMVAIAKNKPTNKSIILDFIISSPQFLINSSAFSRFLILILKVILPLALQCAGEDYSLSAQNLRI